MAIRPRTASKASARKNKLRYKIDFTYINVVKGNSSFYPHEHTDKLPTPAELFTEDYGNIEGVKVLTASLRLPYRCASDQPCARPVAFLVNGQQMCQTHMLEEVRKGDNPDIIPEQRDRIVELELDKPLPSDLPVDPINDDEDE